jgi:hypothetical protein
MLNLFISTIFKAYRPTVFSAGNSKYTVRSQGGTAGVTQATGGVTQTVSIVDNAAVTHNLTFVAGVLTAYSTA